jgi:hypothetical protein
MPPHFGQPPALLGCDNKILRWPGPFGFGFLSPQPPGIVGIGPSAEPKTRANESWSFLLLRTSLCEKLCTNPPCRQPPSLFSIPPRWRRQQSRTRQIALRPSPPTENQEISAGTCRPRPASGQACRGCRPGHTPPRHRRRLAQRCRSAPSSFPGCRSSRRPSGDYARHCGR